MDAKELIRQVLAAQRDLYLRSGDKILFVVDDPGVIIPARDALLGYPYPYEVVIIPKKERPGQDYELDESRLNDKTVGWLITSVSASHSPATKKMLDRKMFLISNPGITPDWPVILDPSNREPCHQKAERILEAIGGDVGGEIHISADDGTSLWLLVPDGNWQKEVGQRDGVGTNGPYGELCTAPFEANGVYVLKPGDFLTNPINEITKPIRLEIKSNHVIQILGGEQAEMLIKMLDDAKNQKAFSLGEFSFGLNPGRPRQLHRSVIAEKLDGGIHIAIGTNAVCLKEDCPDIGKFQYGRYSAGVHVDCVKFGARVIFDSGSGEIVIVRQGRLVV